MSVEQNVLEATHTHNRKINDDWSIATKWTREVEYGKKTPTHNRQSRNETGENLNNCGIQHTHNTTGKTGTLNFRV